MGSAARISVLIPVFNRKDLVGGAIHSVLSLDVEGLEVIVVDNHSDDGTWELLQTFMDPRLRVFRNSSNLGIFGNFNRCAALAAGEFSIFLCSDDRLHPDFVARAVRQMKADTNIVLLSSRGRIIDESGKEGRLIGDRFPPGTYDGRSVVPAWFWTSYNYGANPLNYPSGIMLRTDAVRRNLPFRAELGALADVDMYLRVLAEGDLYVSDDVGCYVMRHREQAGLVARRSGELMLKDLALLAEFRSQLEGFGIYQLINRQISCLALAALLRVARVDFRSAHALFHALGRSPVQMTYAALKRVFLVSLDRAFGYRVIPYLTAVGHSMS